MIQKNLTVTVLLLVVQRNVENKLKDVVTLVKELVVNVLLIQSKKPKLGLQIEKFMENVLNLAN